MDINSVITLGVCVVFIYIIGKIFAFPLKKILKIVLNSILGGFIIYLINILGANFGFFIGINIFTAMFVGLLGIPGAILLIILKLFI